MKKHARVLSSSQLSHGFQIAPMIDVVFVILLYFMVMAGAVRVENAHALPLPANMPSLDVPDEAVVRVDSDGRVYFNEDPLDGDAADLPELTATLRLAREAAESVQTEFNVTIDPAADARYQRVMDVMDSLVRAKITRVAFQAPGDE